MATAAKNQTRPGGASSSTATSPSTTGSAASTPAALD